MFPQKLDCRFDSTLLLTKGVISRRPVPLTRAPECAQVLTYLLHKQFTATTHVSDAKDDCNTLNLVQCPEYQPSRRMFDIPSGSWTLATWLSNYIYDTLLSLPPEQRGHLFITKIDNLIRCLQINYCWCRQIKINDVQWLKIIWCVFWHELHFADLLWLDLLIKVRPL